MKKLVFQVPNVPRSLVLLADLMIITLSFALSYFILKQFRFPLILRGHFFIYLTAYCAGASLVFYLMKIHSGVVRYTTVADMFRIFTAIFIASAVYATVDSLYIKPVFHINSLNTKRVLFVNFFVSSSILIMMRIVVRGVYSYLKRGSKKTQERIVIYGADAKAIVIKQALESGPDTNFNVIGFLSTKANSLQMHIQQKRVYNFKHLALLKTKHHLDKLVLTTDEISGGHKQKVVDECLKLGIKILTVPPSDQWVYGRLKMKQIQDLKIEDLLQREPIQISDINIFAELSGKRILITGAAGSIGSELVRQILRYQPSMVILCDQAESDLHEIQLEAEERYPHIEIKTHIASIRNKARMKIPFMEYFPEVVFHAAAYKHVPMMENHPAEAIMTNVLGTKHVADLSVKYGAKKFVMISTDKAVNPTNVMGASKRIAEIYIQSLNNSDDVERTKFMTTRFGNVLDSNGSVIPRFRNQIQNGGPLTVTHPEIVRYFMTIPEAVQLVLEAGSMGKGGEIFVFDMGKPVKIFDLACNMIKLAGLVVDKDIKIVITGLRPGEKLYEELLNDQENVIPTYNEKIKIAHVIQYSASAVLASINDLIFLCQSYDHQSLVKKMKKIVPEFKSQNSVYQVLDSSHSLTS